MSFRADIGIIGAMDAEVESLIAVMQDRKTEKVGGIEFNTGIISDKNIVVAKCGVGKVFAALCAEAMAVLYTPSLIVNTGVGGAADINLKANDVVFADKLLQYDMDTSAVGDPVGMISGINKIYFDSDKRAVEILKSAAEELGIDYKVGTVATGDKFVASPEEKILLSRRFGAVACEMEGGAIAHVSFVNDIPFVVVRAISDSVFGDASVDFFQFLKTAAEVSAKLTLRLISLW